MQDLPDRLFLSISGPNNRYKFQNVDENSCGTFVRSLECGIIDKAQFLSSPIHQFKSDGSVRWFFQKILSQSSPGRRKRKKSSHGKQNTSPIFSRSRPPCKRIVLAMPLTENKKCMIDSNWSQFCISIVL